MHAEVVQRIAKLLIAALGLVVFHRLQHIRRVTLVVRAVELAVAREEPALLLAAIVEGADLATCVRRHRLLVVNGAVCGCQSLRSLLVRHLALYVGQHGSS